MKTSKGKTAFVFDNGGKTFDRFTIITRHNGEVNASSCNPFHPQGFGQYCGNVIELRNPNNDRFYDYENGKWNQRELIRSMVSFVREARKNPKWIGRERKSFSRLPEQVQQYIIQLTES